MPNLDSDHSSLPDRLRLRAGDFADAIASLRWRVGALLLIAIVCVAAWGFIQTNRPSSRSVAETSTATEDTVNEAVPTTVAGVVVYISGAVEKPGVYNMPPGSRVGDAIDAAGGTTGGADLDRLNLAAKVTDGQHVLVARQGQIAVMGDATADPSSQQININEATAQQLEDLPGVGPSTAAAIIQYRTQHGAFHSVDDLSKVKGIGPAKLAQIKERAAV